MGVLVAVISAVRYKLCSRLRSWLYLAPYDNDIDVPRHLLCPSCCLGLCGLDHGVELLQPFSYTVGETADQRGRRLA